MFILPSAVNAGGKNSIMRITDTSDNKKTYTDTIIAEINSIRKYKTEMKGKRKMYKKKKSIAPVIILILIIIAALAVAVILIPKFFHENYYDKMMRTAGEYELKGEYEKAINNYKNAIMSNAVNDSAYLKLADIYVILDDDDTALKTLVNGYTHTGSDSIKTEITVIEERMGVEAYDQSRLEASIRELEESEKKELSQAYEELFEKRKQEASEIREAERLYDEQNSRENEAQRKKIWHDAFKNTLNEYTENNSEATIAYELYDVDKDGKPELFVSTGQGETDECYVYNCHEAKSEKLEIIGAGGYLYASEEVDLIKSELNQAGAHMENIYSFEKNMLKHYMSLFDTYGAEGEYAGEKTAAIDGQEVGESEYKKQTDRLASFTWKKLGRKNKLDKNNIDKVLEKWSPESN